MIFPHTCLKCGRTCEPSLVEVAQVLAIYCDCNALIRYGHVDEYPDLTAVKAGIWDMCLRDQSTIYIIFEPGRSYPRRVFWKVYRDLFEKLQNKFC